MLALIIASAVALTNPATRIHIDQFTKLVRPVVAAKVAKMRMHRAIDQANSKEATQPTVTLRVAPEAAHQPLVGPNGAYRIRII